MASPQNQWTNATTPITPTGNVLLDSLLCAYKAGGAVGTGALLSFSFPWTTSAAAAWATNPIYSPLNEPANGFGLSVPQQAAVRTIMATWSQVANVQFVEVPETPEAVGDIRIAWTPLSNSSLDAWTWQCPDFYASASDIWLSSPRLGGHPESDWMPGGFTHLTLMHELGHVLGLSHPFEGDVVLPSAYNSSQYTVMSYTAHPHSLFYSYSADIVNPDGSRTVSMVEIPVYPSTPMLLDIAAIQHLYGANMTWHSGNDVYTFDPAKPFIATLWDAGGNDTISVSNFGTNTLIDLREGHFSSLTILPDASQVGLASLPLASLPSNTYDGTDNLAIAWGAVIENAIGGSGHDVLIGNSFANQMTGNAGNDYINGGMGNDTINGGTGIDISVYGGNRSNYVVTRTGNDLTVSGDGDGTDTLVNVERLKFADIGLAFDINGNAGQAYRLYQAAFDRTPDTGGLSYWIDGMDEALSLTTVASGFIGSAEFLGLYGANPTDAVFAARLYSNVLHRAPDEGGLGYWVGQLDGGMSRESVLIGFSESAENQVALIGVLQDGITYVPG